MSIRSLQTSQIEQFSKMSVYQWCLFICFLVVSVRSEIKPWWYRCDQFNRCVRDKVVDEREAQGEGLVSLAECKLTCDKNTSVLWPLPRELEAANTVTAFPIDNIEITNLDSLESQEVRDMVQQALDRQLDWVKEKNSGKQELRSPGVLVGINIMMAQGDEDSVKITRNTNETYGLSISYNEEDKYLDVKISAQNYFGVRHALETLFQLVEYDDIRRTFIILNDVEIRDYPEFPHRGLTLDTSRNFITVDTIKRIIDGLSASKLNVLHWHIVDTHAFPVEHKSEPISQMAEYGSYGPDKIYTQEQIKDLVHYANERGVRVIPELDQPAHVGNGWQFPEAENFTVCFGAEPWYDFCVEPPCGQLNPTEPGVYDVLEQIYGEWFNMFDFDSFHMGADEVHFGCWNSSELVTDKMESRGIERTKDGFIQLWSEFQKESSRRLRNVVQDKVKNGLQLIVWNSEITRAEHIDNLPHDDYVIQVWSNSTDYANPEIKTLAEKGYQLIFSNWDKLYLDCGYSAWVGKGNNWCTPYKGWQLIYEFDPYEVLRKHLGVSQLSESIKDQVLGGETAMWTEQVDTYHVEGKIFPRTAAYGERLWSNPESTGFYEAEQRMLAQRERLVQRGVRADSLQPEWCRLNEGQCYVQNNNPWITPDDEQHESSK